MFSGYVWLITAISWERNPRPIKINPLRVEFTSILSGLKFGVCRNLDLNAGNARNNVPTKPHDNPNSVRVLKSNIKFLLFFRSQFN